MLEFLETPRGVIALRMGGRIEGSDLDAVLDRLEPMLETHPKTHLYVEVRTLTGIAVDGLARYAGRAMPLFGKLSRFGRVAVVADQAWVRWATKLESAILPGISYRTFTPDEREQALAWVKGADVQD